MRTLIVEDDLTSRFLLSEYLRPHGEVETAGNGKDAVRAVEVALSEQRQYDLICLDIMMPVMDGHDALRTIRDLEEFKGISPGKAARVLMTTALCTIKNVNHAYYNLCDGYLVKPISNTQLQEALRQCGLVP